MADILLVAATSPEVRFLSDKLKSSKEGVIYSISKGTNNIDVLVTGPGIVATTYHLAKAMARKRYNLAINLGICGSLNNDLQPVRIVNVITDLFSDFGAENGDDFLDVFSLGIIKESTFPFTKKKLHATFNKSLKSLKAVPETGGITVQTSSGSTRTQKRLFERYGPVVESMEGAAFFYVCNHEKTKCMQLRAISNMVEKRNRKNWKIKEAIDALAGVTGLLLLELETVHLHG